MSETLDLFKAALGLGEPWRVTRSDFDVAQGRLDLYLDFPRGARFGCAVAGCDQGSCPVHDTEAKTWRHLDFFQYKAFLHARVPRTRCPEHGVHLVEVAWARPESGFTLLFEALLIEFATAMPVARVAAMTREHDTRIWRVLEYHVAVQREKLSFADVRRVGMDETSARKGQDYVTTFMDLDARRVLFATEGRDSATVAAFAADLTGDGGDPERISDTSSDMSPAFIAGIGEHLPNAKLTYGAKRSRLQPIKDFVKLVETHWDGIVGWHDSRISNGPSPSPRSTTPAEHLEPTQDRDRRCPQQNPRPRWPILDEDYRYVLAAFIVVPIRWIDCRGWRVFDLEDLATAGGTHSSSSVTARHSDHNHTPPGRRDLLAQNGCVGPTGGSRSWRRGCRSPTEGSFGPP